jgi:hypothetical protein
MSRQIGRALAQLPDQLHAPQPPHSPVARRRVPAAEAPAPRTPPYAGTHTQDAESATGAIEIFRDAQTILPALSAGSTAADRESTQTDGSTPFTTELIALTLMALPDQARQYGPVRDCER